MINNKFLIVIIILLSIIIGTVAILVLPAFPMYDAKTYDEMAIKLINGEGYMLTGNLKHIIPPAYPVLLATIYSTLGHNYKIVYFIQFLLVGIIGIIIFLIGIKHLMLKSWQSLFASLIVVAWPYMVLFSVQLLTEILFIFLFILAVYQILNFNARPNIKSGLWTALLLGLATLTRAVTLLLPFWLAIFFIFFHLTFKKLSNFNTVLRIVILSIFTFAIILAPWSGYASYRKGHFTPVASNFSIMYEKANKRTEKEWVVYKTPGYEPGAELTTKKIIVSKLKNIYRFWESGANGKRAEVLTEKYPFANYLIFIYSIGFYIILAFAFGAFLFARRYPIILLIWLIILYFWGIHIILFPYPRYALPVIPLIILLSVFGITNSAIWLRTKLKK